jgi:phosphoserine phosphatase
VSTAFCFDLDGTITRQEILPAIASELGLSEQMALLTSLTIRGLVPFESSFRLRCQILREVPVSRVRDIVSDIPLDPLIEAFIRDNRDRCAVATGNLDIWVGHVLKRLACHSASSAGSAANDRLDAVTHVVRKDETVQALRARGFRRVVAIGEGFNDVPMFQSADIGVAYGGVHPPIPEIIQLSKYVVFASAALCRLLNTL